MADIRGLKPQKSVSPITILTTLTACLMLSSCNNAGNTIAKLVQADQAKAQLNTQVARKNAIKRVAEQQAKPVAATTGEEQVQISKSEKTFKPNFLRMFERKTVGKLGEFKPPVQLASATPLTQPFPEDIPDPKIKLENAAPDKQVVIVEAPKANNTLAVSQKLDSPSVETSVAVAKQLLEDTPIIDPTKPMGRFRSKLAALKSGKRTKPVTIIHIGDSHVASDSFSQGIRRALQAEFGDAGRGTVVPAGAFKYAHTDQLKQSRSGSWRSDTALKNRKGLFGLAGVNVSSASSSASLKMASKTGEFDAVSVTVATGPKQGSFVVKVGGVSEKFNARSAKHGSKTFRLAARGTTVKLNPAGGGATRVLTWGTQKNQPGIRYDNFGLIGATVNITKRFDTQLVKNDIRAADPDLIVYGYGTNEGFNDNLNLARYTKYANTYLDLLTSAAPNADVVIIGTSDGLRRRKRGGKSCGGGWYEPPKLSPLRQAMKQVAADRKAGYWDWSLSMGGKCSANRWAAKGLAARDRVHLTSKGYRRSAAAFASWLAGDQSKPVKVALGTK